MIHAYDRYFGPLKNKILVDCFDSMDVMDVAKTRNKQMVNGYDAHGKYFCQWIEKIKHYGVTVKISYLPNDNRLMKKIDENFNGSFDSTIVKHVFGNDVIIEEESHIDDPEYKDMLEQTFGAIKNCKKNFTYIDKDHWIFTIV